MIFFDMDGTLVDHMTGVCEWTGKTLAELITPGQWEVPEVDWASLPMTFWATLPTTPEFKTFAGTMSGLVPDVYILTHACSDDCYAGKMFWLQQHLPAMVEKTIFTEHKHLLAAPGRTLFDDRDLHINNWVKAGGDGRLIPRLWNSGRFALQSQA